uniref:Uncharacterized protein n=1 Tax=Anguilla anguilla TaxID=7936 RepID=A0A0E9SHS3_ANGAN
MILHLSIWPHSKTILRQAQLG